jgi:DNA mismatch endonuclease, patch repair protein
MSAIRSSGTRPEKVLKEQLRGVFGPRRRVIERPPLPGTPDYYFPGLRLAVFADGCFWHSCPAHGHVPEDNSDYWEPKLAGNVARDKAAMMALRRSGIRVVRIWEHDLRRAPSRVRRRLMRVAREIGARGAA